MKYMRIKLKYTYKAQYKRVNTGKIVYSEKCATKRDVIKSKRLMQFKAVHDGHIKSWHKFFVKKIFNGLSFS